MKNPISIPAMLFKRQLLQDSDWTQLPDVPLTDEQKTAWATYRQQVRDTVVNPGFQEQVDFPDKPQV